MPADEFLSQVEYWSNGGLVVSVTFITNKGTKSPIYGPPSGEYSLVTFPDGYRVIGLYGRHIGLVTKLGFILGRTVIPGEVQRPHETELKRIEVRDRKSVV